MESSQDQFFLALQKRQRNLVKKLDRIKKKEAELKSSGKEAKDDEIKMLESKVQTEDFLAEIDRVLELYQQLKSPAKKDQKVPAQKAEDEKSANVIKLWSLGEFLKVDEVKEVFRKSNHGDSDLEPFLSFHSLSQGETGERFQDIYTNLKRSVDLYLSRSEKVAPGTLRTYRNLSDFANNSFNWASSQAKPKTSFVPHEAVESKPEVKPEAKEVVKEVIRKEETKTPVVESNWSKLDEEAEEAEEQENDGFVEVTRKKPTKNAEKKEEKPRGRGRGNRGGKREFRKPQV